MKKRLLSGLLSLALCLSLLPTAALAEDSQSTIVGGFTVSGGTPGTDYSYSNGVLTVNDGADITISTSGQTTDRIVVAQNATATITLAGVSITPQDKYTNYSAIDIPDGASLTIILQENTTNTLTGGTNSVAHGAPGIHVPSGASLTIKGSGTLTVTGGSGGAANGGGTGIGGKASSGDTAAEACGTVIIYGGNITVTGGDTNAGYGGAGIGGGTGGGSHAGGNGGTVLILGGTVSVTGGPKANSIGGGNGPPDKGVSDGQGIKPSGNNTYEVYGELTLPFDITVPEGSTLIIPADVTLTVPSGITFTIEEGGFLENNGTIIIAEGGKFDIDGDVTGTGSLNAEEGTVEKKTPTVPLPVLKEAAENSITLQTVTDAPDPDKVYYGYIRRNLGETIATWRQTTIFDKLSPGTPYPFFVLYLSNDYYNQATSGEAVFYTLPKITTASLPDGYIGAEYNAKLEAEVGKDVSVTWTATGLPDGLTLDAETGAITGTPESEVSNGTVKITATIDGTSPGVSNSADLTINIQKGTPDIEFISGPGSYTYGDTISIIGKITKANASQETNALTEPGANQAALFLGDKQLTEPVRVDADGSFTITYDTGNKGIEATGQTQELTVKYGGSEVLDEGTGTVSITLNKASIGGTVSLSGKALVGETLTAHYAPASGEDTDVTVTYQWYRDNEAITSTTNTAYELTKADIGKSITVEVTATDEWYTGSKTSSAVICKGTQTAPDKPEQENTTTSSITVKEIAANASTGAKAEYSIDNGKTWQTERTFTGLSSGTKYTVIARYQATGPYLASPVSEGVEIYTDSSGGGGTTNPSYPPSVSDTENGDVTVSPTRPKKGDTVTITTEPKDRYKVESVTVKGKDGKLVDVTGREDNIYTFIQPEGKVTIEVDFDVDLPFTDVPENAWYIEGAKYVYANYIMSGTGDTTFSPSAPVSRGMIVQILYNLAGQPEVEGSSGFDDVGKDYWSGDAIAWAVQNGVVGGYGDGTFRPDDNLTREQMAVILRNYAYRMGWEISATGDLSKFEDIPEGDYWAKDALSWAYGVGLLGGTSGTTMDPTGQASRAQIAVIMMRFCQRYVEK